MKKILVIVGLAIASCFSNVQAQEKCLTEIMFQEAAAKDPSILKNRQDLEDWTQNYIMSQSQSQSTNSTTQVNRVIPVVVHVIHYGGPENISKAQILDQIRVLNEDYNYLNADSVNTPAVFKPLAGVTNIEFRMAQLDPSGNCTDGINRVYSPLTYNARNNVKALSYWASDKYLNMWIVSSIENSNGSPGQVIGFAQFPGTGPAATDGVVIKHDFMGTIGTASTSDAGRTSTHEVGHWLNLRHIWGDATCGNDQVSDTPTQYEANLSICPTWPHISNCAGSAPNGDMYTNYMDYTTGGCQNMFSAGQSTRMNAALSFTPFGRDNLWSAANLTFTGTDGTPAVLCSPVADFPDRPKFVCEGGSVQFSNASWGGDAASRLWTFPGGNPATDTSANPTVVYSTAGTYDVILSVTNAAGTHTKTAVGMVIVSPTVVSNTVFPMFEGFESGVFPSANDWHTYDANGGTFWDVNNAAAATGQYSINLYTYQGADKGPDDFVTNAFDLSNVTGTSMSFKLAYATKNTTSTNDDKLVVYYSTNCGQTWTPRYSKSGTSLQTTVASVPSDFLPSASQWRTETINLSSPSISTKPNVRFRFEFSYDTGNNIYIDDINLSGIVGVNEVNAQNSNVVIYPNPSKSVTYVDFNVTNPSDVIIEVFDIQGRIVSSFKDYFSVGDHQFTMNSDLEKGVYMVRLTFGDHSVTKRVVIN
ncbi:MAG: T9SS type A sorting domain-containing protein [Bacteroidetes bacterium]|nr:T9SS type A sorting domain-containing protein [Bacteroidota bacterium]